MARLAVAHVVPFFAPMVTGVGTHVWNICRGLPEIGFRILTPALRGEPRREPLFPNAEVIRVQPRAYWHEHYPPPYHPQFSPLVEEVLHLVRLVRIRAQVGRAEVVHNHMAPFEQLYRLARRPGMKGISRLAGSALTFGARKVITTDHSLFSHLGEEEPTHPENRDMARSLLTVSNTVICVEPSGVSAAKALADEVGASPDILYIPNSVDPQLFRPMEVERPDGVFRVGYCARASKPGYDHVLRLAQRLPSGVSLWTCVAGSRRSLAKWDSLRRDQNAKVFTNLSPDVMPYFYNSVDCLLNPIDAAGMSLTSLEAMACGLPVIMVRGDRYPLEDERTGLLVNPEPEAISRAIQRLWEDPSLRRRLGQHARERVLAEFSTASVLPRLARLYAG